jgi:hypothetical protein
MAGLMTLNHNGQASGVAGSINQIGLYRQAAALADVRVPDHPMRSAAPVGGLVWDGRAPREYADAFGIRHTGSAAAAPRVVVVHAESRACQ